jgi:C1A family cysteine protease
MPRKYGWKKQPFDEMDLRYSAAKPIRGFPQSMDLRNQLPDCYDQGNTSSCTYHGIAGSLQSAMFKAGIPVVMPSRLFGYYNERLLEGDPGEDAGAEIRDGMKVTNVYGYVPETIWPFDESKVTVKPSQQAYDAAVKERIHFYASVNLRSLDSVRLPLSHGYPVIIGFDVYDYFESDAMATSGVLNMPKKGEHLLGGHCVLVVGYNDVKKAVLVRNSWGTGWGIMRGHFWMSYDYLTSDLCSDGWMLRLK